MSNNTLATSDGTDVMQGQTPTGYAYSIGFSFGFLVVLIVITYASYVCVRRRAERDRNNRPAGGARVPIDGTTTTSTTPDDSVTIRIQGIDETTLMTYPKLLYSQIKPHKGDDSTASPGCSICLGDYEESDVIRVLPDCGHLFHLKCVDPWLRLHTSCPICRTSPVTTPDLEVVPIAHERQVC